MFGSFLYELMKIVPSRFCQRTFWWVVRKTGIAAHLSDESYLKLQLLGVTGERYAMPRQGGGINSCILWQRLNWRKDIPMRCCDKWAVREFVRERVGDEYLIPLLPDGECCFENVEDVPFDKLPNRFVLKLNNGSGMNMIVKDKSKLCVEDARRTLAVWLNSRYASRSRESQYEGVENKIICEKMIETENGEPPMDYKIMCADGKPLYIWVDMDRFVRHRRNVYTIDWKTTGVRIAYGTAPETEIPRPENLDEMLSVASALSKGIPVVRIDLYNVRGKIYFGEMTFTSDCGIAITVPHQWSIEMAKNVVLPSNQN